MIVEDLVVFLAGKRYQTMLAQSQLPSLVDLLYSLVSLLNLTRNTYSSEESWPKASSPFASAS